MTQTINNDRKPDYKIINKNLIDIILGINSIGNSINGNIIEYSFLFMRSIDDGEEITEEINLSEFIDKCKTWLVKDCHRCVWSGNGWRKLDGYECSITSFYGGDTETFENDKEWKAVLDACYFIVK
jgi:hypothetical protein